MKTTTSFLPKLTPLQLIRRERIIEGAENEFLTKGFRAVSMESLALSLGVSKVTLYKYFVDKEAVFAAVSDRFATRLREAVKDKLASAGTVRERICAALIVKHAIVDETVRRSNFSLDIFEAKDRVSAKAFQKLDTEIEEMLVKQLATELPRKEARLLAGILFASAQGIANRAQAFKETARDIEYLVAKCM
jgi:AcrR family transcriptional regulator